MKEINFYFQRKTLFQYIYNDRRSKRPLITRCEKQYSIYVACPLTHLPAAPMMK